MSSETKVTVIGAGRMGAALVRALLSAGYTTTVWNRTASKCAPLAEAGARVAGSVEDAVRDADVVIVNVDRYPTSDGLMRDGEVARSLRRRLLVQSTSGSPDAAREGARWAREQGIDYLDAAILATPDRIGAPDTIVLYAGAPAFFERHRDVFRALGGAPTYVGDDVGHVSALDSAVLSYMWGSMLSALVGARLCAAEGVPLATYEAFVGPLSPVIGEWVVDLVQRVGARRFGGDTSAADIATHHDAFRHLVELAGAHGLDGAIHEGLDRTFRAAIAAGRGGEDFAALYDFLGRS